MDGGSSGGTATTGGGPAPFLLKTYEMVDDATTDAIVSWSGSRKSFVVWNPPEFARVLLPSYFKHNNFSSFIRQLNTYGFRKIDPEKWEFANEDFVKDQKHLLKNIYRRKPIHSHSQPQVAVDPERAAFEEEIDKLSREKTILEGNLQSYKEQQSAAKAQLENLTPRVTSMAERQERLLTVLEQAIQNPEFVERLAQKLESTDFSAYNKKRRQSTHETVLVDSGNSSKPDFGDISHQDFCNKLRLELSPAVSDVNLLSHSTQSSNEDCGLSPHVRNPGFLCPPETLELSDTGASFSLRMDSPLTCKGGQESPKLQHNMNCNDDETDAHISCLLNLTLASSHSELSQRPNPVEVEQIITEPARPNIDGNEVRTVSNNAQTLASSREGHNDEQGPAAVPKRVNDVFWEQFLTEKPGCSDDTEEASSGFRANHNEHDEKKSMKGITRNTQGMEHLTL